MSRPILQRTGKYPVVHRMVILLAQNIAVMWLINFFFCYSEPAMCLDNASALDLCPDLTITITAPWYRVTALFWML